MKDIPNKIYLVTGLDIEDLKETESFNDLEDIAWTENENTVFPGGNIQFVNYLRLKSMLQDCKQWKELSNDDQKYGYVEAINHILNFIK